MSFSPVAEIHEVRCWHGGCKWEAEIISFIIITLTGSLMKHRLFLLFGLLAMVMPARELRAQFVWQPAGLADSSVSSVNSNSSGTLLACVEYRRPYSSADSGATWTPLAVPGIFITGSALADDGTMYIADLDGVGNGLQRSTDGGAHWTIVADSSTIGCYSLGVSPGGTVYATFVNPSGTTNHFLFRSTDRGTTWQKDSLPFIVATVTLSPQSVYLFAGEDTVMVIGMDGLYRSTDRGSSWMHLSGGLPVLSLNALARGRGGDLYLAAGYRNNAGSAWRSTDMGDSWFHCDTIGLPVFASFAQMTSDGRGGIVGIVRGSPADGVYRSTDDGHSWLLLAAGMTPIGNLQVVVSSVTGTIYCATQFGLYKNGDVVTAVRPPRGLPDGFTLGQNYPNPVNPSTTIPFALGVGGYVRLSIVDLLGREVALLIDEFRPAGSYAVQWDASRYASGVYVCRTMFRGFSSDAAAGVTAVRKIVLVR